MFGEPLTHLLIRPSPLKGMGIAMVVFGPGSQHMGLELLLAPPRRPFQVIVLEGVDEDFRLVQPRGIGRRIPRPPPTTTVGEIALGAGSNVTGATVLDQEGAAQLLVLPVKQLQFGLIV